MDPATRVKIVQGRQNVHRYLGRTKRAHRALTELRRQRTSDEHFADHPHGIVLGDHVEDLLPPRMIRQPDHGPRRANSPSRHPLADTAAFGVRRPAGYLALHDLRQNDRPKEHLGTSTCIHGPARHEFRPARQVPAPQGSLPLCRHRAYLGAKTTASRTPRPGRARPTRSGGAAAAREGRINDTIGELLEGGAQKAVPPVDDAPGEEPDDRLLPRRT
ncbi:MAG TPA: hypothetical protein VN520_04630, partial [Streptomyces sp.]|uniref:hypothetical protein n=1 Tax=Streptomyces sp. TaxID=1931 RepID=UPI002D09D48B